MHNVMPTLQAMIKTMRMKEIWRSIFNLSIIRITKNISHNILLLDNNAISYIHQ